MLGALFVNLASVKPMSCAIDNCKSESDMAEHSSTLLPRSSKLYSTVLGHRLKLFQNPKARENHKSSPENAVNKHF